MTKQAALAVLLRYRPGTTDEDTPEVREALRLAAADAELSAWLENHRQFQQAFRAAMQDVPMAAGLKEQILSERRVRMNLRNLPRRTLITAVVAGALGLAAAGLVSWFAQGDPEAEFSTFRSRMVRTAARGYSMDLETHSAAEIRNYLKTQQAHSEWESPAGLENERLLGCAVIKWRGQPASMICYGAQSEPDLWLFVVDANAVRQAPPQADAPFAVVNRMATLSWSQAGKVYVLMGYRTEEELRTLSGQSG